VGYVKWIQSGSLLEQYEYEKSLPIRRKQKKVQRRSDGRKPVGRRSHSSLRRATRSFRRIVRANLIRNEKPTLLTLTMYQELPLKASSGLFTSFIARLRRESQTEFKYIGVPEFQKRGAVHFHVLIWGLNHYAEKEHETRHFARLWLRGFCDCLITDGSPRLSGYLAKYMQKTMSDIRLSGEKAYYASRNIMRPVSIAASTLANAKIEIIKQEVIHSGELMNERNFDTPWLGRCTYKRFHITQNNESNNHEERRNHVKR